MHHPIFDEVPGFRGSRPEGVLLDYVGARFLAVWERQYNVCALDEWAAPKPGFNEEYFEWIDLLESVKAAADSYTMIELGAAYGRWGVRGALAARMCGVRNGRFVFVEGEPKHVQWLRESIILNDMSDGATVHERAVSYRGEPVQFIVSHDTLDVGFGQCLGWEGMGTETNETYYGKPIRRTDGGYGQISVDSITFEEIATHLNLIDFVDMDLQRAELELVRHSMNTLNEQVRRVHIGTHSEEIEAELRSTFAKHGWRNVWDFGCFKTNSTPYGEIEFVDGVQGWINPRL